MAGVKRRELVADDRLAVPSDPDLAAVAVSQQHAYRNGARQTLHQGQVLARAAAVNQHARHPRADDESCSRRSGIRQPGLDHRLLGPDSAAETAVTALLALGAPANAARHRVDVPAELHAAFLELLIARRRL